MKENKGITLVALIITIIVMLILVVTTVSILINSNVIGTAKDAGERTKTAYGNESNFGESLTINVDGSTYNSIDEYLAATPGGDGLAGLTSAEQTLATTNGVTEKAYADISNPNLKDATKIKAVLTDDSYGAGKEGEIPIPIGANYVTGTEKTGIVIEYKGSQFVWVPIPVTAGNNLYVKDTTKAMAKVSTATGYSGTTNGLTNYEGVLYNTGDWEYDEDTYDTVWVPVANPQPMTSYGQGTTDFREPDTLSDCDGDTTCIATIGCSTETQVKDELQGSYNLMIDSVKKYGGFYVGRYESCISGTTIASVSGATPMNDVDWYEMYKRQKAFSGSNTGDSMQSSMIWGSQYDAMLNWMLTGLDAAKVNATTNGNHSGSIANTGATTEGKTDIINNIYDLEGNCFEWTAEAYDTFDRVYRSSDYNTLPASVRGYNDPVCTGDNYSSRVALYIK